jgi:hypothetical protein
MSATALSVVFMPLCAARRGASHTEGSSRPTRSIGRLKERYPRVARYFDLAYDPHTAILAAPFNADK